MNHATLLRSLLLLPTTALLLPAQSWAEAGDAGAMPTAAQAPQGVGALTTITGSLSSSDGVDLYTIQIDDPGSFTANVPTGWDSQVFLFDEHGRGISMRDDSGGLSGQFVPTAGRYFLAVSTYDRDPVCGGGEIWNDTPYDIERKPDGVRANEIIAGWNGSGNSGGAYTITLAGVSFPGQQLVLPDHHHLSETLSQYGGSGSTAWWRQGGGRFQVIYEGSHFTSAGVTGPIALKKLMFRGEDGEANKGGATWTGVLVQVGATSLHSGTMSTTFNNNRGAANTTLGPAGLANVTVLPSVGSTPNNYNIVIDLTAISAGFPFDPTSSRPNLLIDISMPVATVPAGASSVMAMQDTTGGTTYVRGRGVSTSSIGGGSGSDMTAPIVCGIEFLGVGGDAVVVPARNELYGAACGGAASSFYQEFHQGQSFDLAGLTMVPNDIATPAYYAVQGGAPALDPLMVNAAPTNTGDDELVSHALPFTFRFPGGSASQIKVCTNGFIWLDNLVVSDDYTPDVGDFLGATSALPARLAPYWTDLNCGSNVATHPNSGLHIRNDTSGGVGNRKCWITWLDFAPYTSIAGNVAFRMQCVLHEDGTVEYRYGKMPAFAFSAGSTGALVGFSRGRIGAVASVDPQSRDLSLEVPFTTSVEGGAGNIGLEVVSSPLVGGPTYGGRAFTGQTLNWNVDNVPAGTLVGVQLLDIVASRPGFSLPTITAPGCILSTSSNATLWEVHVLPSASVNGAVPFVVPAGFEGVELYSQYVVLGGLFGAPDLITSSSNAMRQILGRR